MNVKLPEMPHKGQWIVVFDTSKYCSDKDEKNYKKGDIYTIKPHTMVVFANHKPKQNEKQNLNFKITKENRNPKSKMKKEIGFYNLNLNLKG
jgi:hypothetical protein